MVRRILATSVLTLGLMTGTAAAQDAPSSPGPSVAPNVVERPDAAPLPRTGSDIGVDVIAGVSLTAAGLAFAAVARQRRRKYETAPVVAS